MFYYAFLDPATIDEAAAAGEMGLGRLIELLQGFCKDVILVETDAWRIEEAIRDRVNAIPSEFQNERKLIADLLIWMKRNSPLVMIDGDDCELPLQDFVETNATRADLDLLLTPGEPVEGLNTWTKSSLARCHATEFNKRRAKYAAGRKYKKGDKSFNEVATECFSKLVRHAKVVRIYDYALGEYYNNDQPVNLKRLVRFLRDHALQLEALEILTVANALVSINKDVSDLANEVDFKIDMVFREQNAQLPHMRYLGADKRYLDIDRGVDLCDANDRCRLTVIKYSLSPE